MRVRFNVDRLIPVVACGMLLLAFLVVAYAFINEKPVQPQKPVTRERFRIDDSDTKDLQNTGALEELRIDFQQQLHLWQNPSSCEAAKYLLCVNDISCGFGCQLHALTWCMTQAIVEGRTMVLHPNALTSYGQDSECGNNWNCWFEDISGCQVYATDNIEALNNPTILHTKEMPADYATHREWLPPYLVSRRLSDFTEIPMGWFVGQMVHALMKYNQSITRMIAGRRKKMELDKPVDMAIHVQQSEDASQSHNGEQANQHAFGEYMQHVDHVIYPNRVYHDYYKEDDYEDVAIYVSTDNSDLAQEFPRYPMYKFASDTQRPKQDDDSLTGYTDSELKDILFDLHIMSEAEFFVGTLSTEIGRLMMELMFARGLPDVPRRFHSLDGSYLL